MLNGSLVTSPAPSQISCIFFYFKFVVEAKVPVIFSCEQEPMKCPFLQPSTLYFRKMHSVNIILNQVVMKAGAWGQCLSYENEGFLLGSVL